MSFYFLFTYRVYSETSFVQAHGHSMLLHEVGKNLLSQKGERGVKKWTFAMIDRKNSSGNFSIHLWRQYLSLFISITPIVSLLLTSDRKKFPCKREYIWGIHLD